MEGIGDEHLVTAAGKSLAKFDFDSSEIVIVESGGKDRIISFMSVLDKLGLKTWALLDLDFLWDGAGDVFHSDEDYTRFCQDLNRLVPADDKPQTEADKRAKKQKKVDSCQKELKESAEKLTQRLMQRGLYVLRAGDIEKYFGMSDRNKSQYVKYARAVLSGEAKIEPTEDFQRLFADLKAWSLSTLA